MSDVVVIGAGMGGLCAAIDLARQGLSVTLVEAASQVGGKANTAEHAGVQFDTGPSVLTMPHVFESLLHDAGTSLAEQVELTRPSPACRYVFADGFTLDVHDTPSARRAAIAEGLGEATADEVEAFLAYAERIWTAAAPNFVEGDAPSIGSLLKLGFGAVRQVAHIDPFRTMRGAIRRQVHDPRARWMLERFATYNGSDPRRAPATLNCIAHVELTGGVHGVRGGIYALVHALLGVAKGLGVAVRTGVAVTSVNLGSDGVESVCLETDERLPCRAVVANADTRHLLRDLLPASARTGLNDEPEPSMSGWTAVLKARRRPSGERVGHTVLFPRDYTAEFADIFDKGKPPEEPTVYLCAQEHCHDRDGWDAHEPLFIMANAPAEPAEGASAPEQWPALRETVLARLRAADLIDPDDEVVWERSPRGLALAFPGTRGALYGAASNDPFAAFRRPPNRVAAVRGLYLASGSAHPGGGVPLAALSGRAAARAVVADLMLES